MRQQGRTRLSINASKVSITANWFTCYLPVRYRYRCRHLLIDSMYGEVCMYVD